MDDGAFEELYAAQYGDLLRYALRRVQEPADAADVVAETWVIAWRRRGDLPPSSERRLWLFGVARRVLANQRRGQLRRSLLADRLREELDATVSESFPMDGPALNALRQLSPEDQDLLAMRAWEQLTADEMATILGCNPAAVRVRLHRARRRLRAALGSESPALAGPPCPPRGVADGPQWITQETR